MALLRGMLAGSVALLLAGCAAAPVPQDAVAGLAGIYQPMPLEKGAQLQKPAGEPCLEQAPTSWADNPRALIDRRIARGEAWLGYSLVTTPQPILYTPMVMAQAKHLGAGCVLLFQAAVVASEEDKARAALQQQAPVAGYRAAYVAPAAQTWAQGAAYFAPRREDYAYRVYGWSFTDTLPERYMEKGRKGGAMLRYLEPDGAAARAGLQPGDILTRFAGERIASGKDLYLVAQALVEEDEVIAGVFRQGEEVAVPLRIAVRPAKSTKMSAALKELRELRDLGILTRAEYDRKRLERIGRVLALREEDAGAAQDARPR